MSSCWRARGIVVYFPAYYRWARFWDTLQILSTLQHYESVEHIKAFGLFSFRLLTFYSGRWETGSATTCEVILASGRHF